MSAQAEYELVCFRNHRTYRVVFGGVDVGRFLSCDKVLSPTEGYCGAAYKIVHRLAPAAAAVNPTGEERE